MELVDDRSSSACCGNEDEDVPRWCLLLFTDDGNVSLFSFCSPRIGNEVLFLFEEEDSSVVFSVFPYKAIIEPADADVITDDDSSPIFTEEEVAVAA